MLPLCIVFGSMIALFLILGILFQQGKGKGLIAGYNVMSERERAQYDEKKLMKIMSRGMFCFAGCMALSLAGALMHRSQLVSAGFGVLAVVAIVLVVLLNTKAKR